VKAIFHQINEGWNAEPNAPNPSVEVRGEDLVLTFRVNPYQFRDFEQGEAGVLRFVQCERYRLGSPDDVGWYRGRCRFSSLAPKWGEFYRVEGDAALLGSPGDWKSVRPLSGDGRHYLFYFRDETFECVAAGCVIEPTEENSLYRRGKKLANESAQR
jgi:hypothetical protein